MWKVTTSFVRKVPSSLKPDELKEAIAQVFVFVFVRASYQLNLAQPDCNWWPAVMESNVYLPSFQTE